ncbi:NAD(P)-binding protein [Saccharata proteae CBS 121410]|uniref:NAD(P)-binding protein n=1 Tax=Saccharata proteae CBS 121410 TaxID=1314787 RepID=A0A9P4HZR0_9PEZI|nr:NAD(P)-binding protein [Saccharata proteae CBS 121410]
MSSPKQLRVGVVGAGEVAQVIHLPCLSLLSHLYTISSICDISRKNASHCAAKFHIPKCAADAYEVINDPAVDVVFILTSDEFHAVYAIAALEAGKHVMIEKPITLSMQAAQRIIEAEKKAAGPRVFVGYMRRYAPSFTQAFKREIASIPRILYARVRDFSGPNTYFVNGSGTFQVKNTDFPEDAGTQREKMLRELYSEAFDGKVATPERKNMCRFLGSLGSHDISLMREALGFPESVGGVTANDPFYSAIFNFRNKTGEPFAVTYESGIDSVPEFDAHLAVYGQDKRVTIHYDSPYVKGLPIKVVVVEKNEHGEIQKREMLTSYEDAYTAELQEMHACFTEGKAVKTTAEDALQDLKLYDLIYKKYEESR